MITIRFPRTGGFWCSDLHSAMEICIFDRKGMVPYEVFEIEFDSKKHTGKKWIYKETETERQFWTPEDNLALSLEKGSNKTLIRDTRYYSDPRE